MTWFVMRGTGVVLLVLFSMVIVLGAVTRTGRGSRHWPRFVTLGLHRNLALLALALLGVHVVSAVLDTYVDIRWVDVVVPVGARFEPVYLGLGALAVDLLIAVGVTTAVRSRIGYQGWRAVHVTGYVAWAVSLVHALGLGSDIHSPWLTGICVGCVLCVAAALVARAAGSRVPA